MLDAETIAVIKKTAPLIATRGEELTRLFYERLFSTHPALLSMFSVAHQRSGAQQRALAGAIVAYASNIDQLGKLGPAVEVLAQKHASLGVRREQYPIVGENLLAAIRELLGEAATAHVLSAWGKAYGVLASLLIEREEAIYREHDVQFGGRGFRRFRVERRVVESEEIVSLYLVPVDGLAIGRHRPGQYVTIRTAGPRGDTTMRNYSLSQRPGAAFYRISVKRERASAQNLPHGHVSGYLHDVAVVGTELEIGPPCGTFVFDAASASASGRPVVLLSGGVGVTPLLSMLHAAVDAAVSCDVWFIHSARNGRVHAFSNEVRELAGRHGRTRTFVCHDEAEAGGSDLGRVDAVGRIDLAMLQRLLPGPDGEFYVCGPKPFMQAMLNNLRAWGVTERDMRFEFFGPAEVI